MVSNHHYENEPRLVIFSHRLVESHRSHDVMNIKAFVEVLFSWSRQGSQVVCSEASSSEGIVRQPSFPSILTTSLVSLYAESGDSRKV